MDYDKEMKVAEIAINKAGRLLMNLFEKNIVRKGKGERDFLTEADIRAEKEIIQTLKRFPYPILSEESHPHIETAEKRWIVDPLDGTHNFYYGIPLFGTQMAFEVDNKIAFSIIYLPFFHYMYTAVKGMGSFLNGKRIYVSKRKSKFMYASGIHDYYTNENLRNLFEKAAMKFSPDVRIFGCAAFTIPLIAKGSIDGAIGLNVKFWDIAPGILLVEEAGGKVTDIYGKRWNNKTEDFIVSNGIFHKELLNMTREVVHDK